MPAQFAPLIASQRTAILPVEARGDTPTLESGPVANTRTTEPSPQVERRLHVSRQQTVARQELSAREHRPGTATVARASADPAGPSRSPLELVPALARQSPESQPADTQTSTLARAEEQQESAPSVEGADGISVQRAGAGAGTGPAPGAAAQSPQALDELAGRIYDRIRSRLRDELLVDRERAGLVTDVR
jgi:hypothetical protein